MALISFSCLVAFAAASIGISGAYYSDSKAGAITGANGTISVTGWGGSGGNNLDLAFNNLLPGVAQTVVANFKNTGTTPQDVYIVFNQTALSALSNLGSYGEVHMSINGAETFVSKDLNDHPVDQGLVDYMGNVIKTVPQKYKVASDLAPGAIGSWSFSFNLDGVRTTGSGGGVWNTYPLVASGTPAGTGYPNDGNIAGYNQHYFNATDGTGAGLPYKIVAVQVGQQP
jgi:hypothetical protein